MTDGIEQAGSSSAGETSHASLPLGQVFSTAITLYTRHWPFMVGAAAIVMICALIAGLLNLLPVVGTLLFMAAVGTAQGALLIAVVSKLRGVRPAMPQALRAISLQRLLEIIVAGGVLLAATTGLQVIGGALFIGVLAAGDNAALAVLMVVLMILIVIVSVFVSARLSYAAVLAVDVSSPESEPFSRLADAWRLTRGRVIGLVILQIVIELVFWLSLLVPVVGTLLIGLPFRLACQAAAYLALRGEPLAVPEKLGAGSGV